MWTVQEMPLYETQFFRCAVVSAAAAVVTRVTGHSLFGAPTARHLLAARAIMGLIASSGFIYRWDWFFVLHSFNFAVTYAPECVGICWVIQSSGVMISYTNQSPILLKLPVSSIRNIHVMFCQNGGTIYHRDFTVTSIFSEPVWWTGQALILHLLLSSNSVVYNSSATWS